MNTAGSEPARTPGDLPGFRTPLDRLTAAYLFLSALLAFAWSPRLDPPSLLPGGLFLGGAIAVYILPPLLRKGGSLPGRFLAAWYPILAFLFFYRSTALLNQGSPFPLLDPWLAELDRMAAGGPVCEILPAVVPGRAFAELMAFCYFSYYLMIPGMGLYLWLKRRSRFEEFLFTTAACFYFFYLFFSLFPSYGPQYYLREGTLQWDGWFFGPLLSAILTTLEEPTGAFPSSHLGVALIVTTYAWREGMRPGVLLSLLSSGLAAATLYGGPHYLIDIPCGIAVGALFALLAPAWQRKLDAARESCFLRS